MNENSFENKNEITIPENAKNRLLNLYEILNSFDKESDLSGEFKKILESKNIKENQKFLTSAEIASLTFSSEATVRRDIFFLKENCSTSKGYSIQKLKNAIQNALKMNFEKKVKICIIGLGKTGLSFLDENLFENSQFELCAAFDSNQNTLDLIKTKIPLFATIDLEKMIRRLNIEYALLCVSNGKANFMAERLFKANIKGIINYTSSPLILPDKIKIVNASPSILLNSIL